MVAVSRYHARLDGGFQFSSHHHAVIEAAGNYQLVKKWKSFWNLPQKL
jgi:hypothetical protein